MNAKPKKELSFEAALRELDQIADTLEKTDQDIEASVLKFERGLELIRFLKSRLAKTDLTIKELKTKYRDVFSEAE
jgi:exodeoxyribonuclease VII small subunit